MSKQFKRNTNGKTKEVARHTLRVPPDVSDKAGAMAGEDLQTFPKFITKLVINEWERRQASKKVTA